QGSSVLGKRVFQQAARFLGLSIVRFREESCCELELGTSWARKNQSGRNVAAAAATFSGRAQHDALARPSLQPTMLG
ncbi:MAG: hypothetical protein M3380_02610, partial [Chloroflexota bacterium]|nr:hypothetical protein [Chloroflexota bacterium]